MLESHGTLPCVHYITGMLFIMQCSMKCAPNFRMWFIFN